ncbi:hypothetical protein ACSNN9_07390 [Micromonospora sp. URMC 107]|uniref:hypothetical protein n=1 Tax=Micromonospora sp. URMC 107 TaxID=3423418 RepID=UPI003F1B3828
MSYADPGAAEVIDRATIRMPYLPDSVLNRLERLAGACPVVEPDSPVRARRAVERLGRQFHRESGFDFQPYSAEDPEGQVAVLVPSRDRALGGGELLAGAVGVEPAARYSDLPAPVPAVLWIYLHPYERGRRLIERMWPAVVSRWPGIWLPGPFTKSGRALANRLVSSGLQAPELVPGLQPPT